MLLTLRSDEDCYVKTSEVATMTPNVQIEGGAAFGASLSNTVLGRSLIWRTIFVCKFPFTINESCLYVIVGVHDGIPCAAVT